VKPAGLDPTATDDVTIAGSTGGGGDEVLARSTGGSGEGVITRGTAGAGDEVISLPEPRSFPWRVVWELLHDVSVAVLFCFFLVTFVAQAFRVQGTSMQPLLDDGERIVVNKLLYRFHAIERGDVVVFWWPRDPKVSFIKRVVALPGDKVEIRDGVLSVNDRVVDEPYVLHAPGDSDASNMPAKEVPQGFYFVLGDHRGSSNDSRNWGEVPEKYIYGKALARFWPVAKAGAIH
jgi:signal peptidase I